MKIEEIMATVLDDEAYRSFGISFGAKYAALVAKKQTSALEQAGFQIVPVEPSDEMKLSGHLATVTNGHSNANGIYKAMLAQAKKEMNNE